MKLLALDTSTEACSAAVLVDGEVIERYELAPRRHAALILSMIEAVLAEAGLSTGQLDALAFGRGPGAFTGIRIGVGVVQGIAFAADLPVAPVSTLAAVARQACFARNASHIAVAMDARMGEVYWGSYFTTAGGGLALLGEEQVCSPSLVPVLNEAQWLGAGTGWTVYHQALVERLGHITWWGDCYPRAGDIALLGAAARQRGQWVAAEHALPVYVRDEVVHKS